MRSERQMGKMNLTDLHYVVEIDKSGSISKAAKELYVAQPNLSKAIKHLEREFGISIFERSSKGVKATREGQKFLEYAKRIIYEIEEMKRDCSDLGKENLSFKITVPRASYISSAFAEFIGMQSKETAIRKAVLCMPLKMCCRTGIPWESSGICARMNLIFSRFLI